MQPPLTNTEGLRLTGERCAGERRLFYQRYRRQLQAFGDAQRGRIAGWTSGYKRDAARRDATQSPVCPDASSTSFPPVRYNNTNQWQKTRLFKTSTNHLQTIPFFFQQHLLPVSSHSTGGIMFLNGPVYCLARLLLFVAVFNAASAVIKGNADYQRYQQQVKRFMLFEVVVMVWITSIGHLENCMQLDVSYFILLNNVYEITGDKTWKVDFRDLNDFNVTWYLNEEHIKIR